ncbi:diguanylate cyclase [Clostridium sp. MSJ-11]|uniref:Diguanylate cyclase n=1 Tax=Clostridium mobile TaxID=2841512 RepID=A0ABS6EEF9_9CLOT|nr:diguanylate cyclase [Clostridium mobile]MBU5483584.1 diguanylate cyclase [Clostridium mobile]
MIGDRGANNKYGEVIENMFDGFMYSKIILDDNSIPIDFIFEEINDKFINMLGTSRENIIAKKGSEILRKYKGGDLSSIYIYGNIALNGGMARFDEYWQGIDKWFSVFIYSDKKDYFAITLIDITGMKRTWNKINKLSDSLVRYLQLPFGNIDYSIICKDILKLSEGKIAALIMYDKRNGTFKFKSLQGLDENLKVFDSIIGYKLLGKNLPMDKRINKLLKEERIVRFYTIGEFLSNIVSEDKITLIKDKINVDYCCSVTIKEGKNILGELIIFMPKYKPIFDSSILELYANYLSSFLIRQNLERELKEKEERWKFAIESNGDGVWDWNIRTNEVIFSNTFLHMLGYEENEISKDFQSFISLIPTEDLHLFYDNLQKHFNGESEILRIEHKLKCKDGYYKECLARGKIVGWDSNGNPNRIVCTHTDITERKRAFQKVAYLCFHDNLTGLYNRAFLEEEMRRLDTKRQLPLTIIMGDVDCLKLVNDAFGHDEGDKLIKNVAKILKKCCREEDIVARTGGDEFVIMLPKVTEERGLRIVEKIKDMCKREVGWTIQPNISLGVATKNNNEESIANVYKKAEERMYNNKLLESKELKRKITNYLTEMLNKKSQNKEEDLAMVKDLALRIGEHLNLSKDEMDALLTLSTIYNIGLIAMPEKLLEKQGDFNEIEMEIIKRHCETGYRIASCIPDFAYIAEHILCHHEYYNGEGYPQGLKGDEIPLLSRIICVLEAYIKYEDKQSGLEEIMLYSGKKYDPKIVDVLEIIVKSHKNMEK